LLKDLTSQVSKLKDEYTMLNEESREVIYSLGLMNHLDAFGT